MQNSYPETLSPFLCICIRITIYGYLGFSVDLIIIPMRLLCISFIREMRKLSIIGTNVTFQFVHHLLQFINNFVPNLQHDLFRNLMFFDVTQKILFFSDIQRLQYPKTFPTPQVRTQTRSVILTFSNKLIHKSSNQQGTDRTYRYMQFLGQVR